MQEIKSEGRASRVGRVRADRGYLRSLRSHRRRTIRRTLKRADRAKALKTEFHLVEAEEAAFQKEYEDMLIDMGYDRNGNPDLDEGWMW